MSHDSPSKGIFNHLNPSRIEEHELLARVAFSIAFPSPFLIDNPSLLPSESAVFLCPPVRLLPLRLWLSHDDHLLYFDKACCSDLHVGNLDRSSGLGYRASSSLCPRCGSVEHTRARKHCRSHPCAFCCQGLEMINFLPRQGLA